jgi:hypothetical protein
MPSTRVTKITSVITTPRFCFTTTSPTCAPAVFCDLTLTQSWARDALLPLVHSTSCTNRGAWRAD